MISYGWREELSSSLGKVQRPVAEIHIKDKNNIWRAITMYIDSGADISIITKNLGELFGHNLKKGKKIELKGISKGGVTAYIHKMDMLIGQDEINVEVAIAENDDIPKILGRRDIFNMFEIHFKNKEEATHFVR